MLASFVAGAYTSTWQKSADSARSLGLMQEGFDLQWEVPMDVVGSSDTFGSSVIESFYQGLNCFIQGTAKEWQQGVLGAVSPWNTLAPTGATSMNLGIIGRAATDTGGPLILTSTAGTPSASSPASLTAGSCLLAENFSINMRFGPTHRVIPWRFRLYPYLSSTIKYFSSTAILISTML